MNNAKRQRVSNAIRDKNILPKGFAWIIGINAAFMAIAASIAIANQ